MRKTLPGLDMYRIEQRCSSARRRTVTQVLYGCRQLVLWDVGLSPVTSVTLAINCHYLVGYFNGTAGDKPEEGGDDVKSSWPL